jgi:beta-lactamase class A
VISKRRSRLLAAVRRQKSAAGGRYSLAARNLESGEEVLVAPGEVFPAASVIKVPLLTGLFAARDEGRLDLGDEAVMQASDVVGGSGVLQEMHVGLRVTLRDLAHLMIVVSDNTATNMLIDRIGLEYIEAFLARHSLTETKLQRRLFDLEARKKGRDNLITAQEIVRVYEMLHRADFAPLVPESCRECLDILERQQHSEKLPRDLPKTARIASKPGGLDDVSHDSGLIVPREGPPYVIAVFTADFAIRARADEAIARTSKLVYDYFTGG